MIEDRNHPNRHMRRLPAHSTELVLASLAGLLMLALGCGSSAEGNIASSGKPLGDFSIDLAQCASGEHRQFFGVFLAPESGGGGIKAMRDTATGDSVQVEAPGSCDANGEGCRFTTLNREICSIFDLVIEQGSNRVNLFWEINGSLDLKCDFEDGSIEAHVRFRKCS
jgi:hypothetical protein